MEKLRITCLGDISFNDSGKSTRIDASEFLEKQLKSDFRIGNLEALASLGEINLLKMPRVTTDFNSLENIPVLGVDLVTLAHNHIYDSKKSGFLATVDKLKELDIAYMGAGVTKEEAERPFVLNKNGVKVGFLNYCSMDTNPGLPEGCDVFLNIYSPSKVLSDAAKLHKECDHVILLLHWGGNFEGGFFPDQYQINDAMEFARAGISVVVGHHSHTLQPYEVQGETSIYYSLGNFIFYDIKHDDKLIKLSPRRKRGGVLNLTFSKTELIREKLFFTKFEKGRITIKDFNSGFVFRSFLFSNAGNSFLFRKIYWFQYKYINPLLYFLFVQEGGISKFQKLNIKKIKRFIWRK